MDHRTVADLLEGIPMPALLVAASGKVTGANAACRSLFGGLDLAGRAPAAFARHPAFLSALDTTLRDATVSRARLTLPGGTAGERTMLVHVAPVSLAETPGAAGAGEAGTAQTGALVTFEDQTALERAELMRRDFVANVSHELRTPLTALMGFIETLRGPARDDAGARDRFLGIMEREAGRMIRLVSDLLSLSRVEADERRRPMEPVDLGALVRTVIQSLKGQAEAAEIEIDVVAEGGPFMVPGDADQIVQVFHNLIENAMKYAASGKRVTVTLKRVERDAFLRGPAIEATVTDYGDGIDPIHIPRLTERFYRVDSHRSRQMGGTGLGLAIVKHIVNRHRGRLRIESTPGKGSSFIVLLPES